MGEQGKACKYIYAQHTCPMIGNVEIPIKEHIKILNKDYYLGVCMNGDVAEKLCPFYQNMRKAEGISKRIAELGEELTGIAGRLNPKT